MTKPAPDLSILVCSVTERADNFAVNIQRQINDQVQRLANPERVEVIVLTDNRHMSIGAKRNHLVNMSTGRYTVFVDDDDELSSDYVSSLLDATASGADVLTFNLEYRLNGKKVRVLKHSLKYTDDNRRGLNTPRHTSAVRRDVALKLPFPESSYGEDFDWATRLLTVAKTEHNTDRTLYIYHDVPATSVARQYAKTNSPAHRAWAEAQKKTGAAGQDYTLGPRLADTYEGTLDHVLSLKPFGVAVEFGTASGASATRIAKHMQVYTFGSNDGLPEDWRPGFGKGLFACETPKLPPNATFIEGLFEDTLPSFDFGALGPIGLYHLDADLYSSTATILKWIEPHIKLGSIIVFDEWHGYPGADGEHEQRAFREFADRTGITWEVLGHGPEQFAIRITGKAS